MGNETIIESGHSGVVFIIVVIYCYAFRSLSKESRENHQKVMIYARNFWKTVEDMITSSMSATSRDAKRRERLN